MSKFFKKCSKTAFLTVFSKFACGAENLAKTGAKQCFGIGRAGKDNNHNNNHNNYDNHNINHNNDTNLQLRRLKRFSKDGYIKSTIAFENLWGIKCGRWGSRKEPRPASNVPTTTVLFSAKGKLVRSKAKQLKVTMTRLMQDSS